MMQFLSALFFLSALLLPAGGWAIVQVNSLAEPSVEVRSNDAGLVLDISYQVSVPPSEAWTTITDFEHQPSFMPNLEVSRVLLRSGNRLWLEQKGAAKFGIFKFHYESQRELALTPCQLIRSHSLSGDIQMDSTMVLYPSGAGTRIAYHVNAVSHLPIPDSIVAPYLKGALRDQFDAMGKEILRRERTQTATVEAQCEVS
ncbi:MAG: SRPBCC family protein [Thiobacillaceae bacterium]